MKLKRITLFSVFILAMVFAFGCSKSNNQNEDKSSMQKDKNSIEFSQVTDKDGNIYKTVKIGTQKWMEEYLNVEHYLNGDDILQIQDKREWKKLTTTYKIL